MLVKLTPVRTPQRTGGTGGDAVPVPLELVTVNVSVRQGATNGTGFPVVVKVGGERIKSSKSNLFNLIQSVEIKK